MGRAAVVVVSIALLGATLEPLLRDPRDDGFPLSTYPMFATKRPTALTMSYPVGLTAAGARRALSPAVIGSAEVLQARAIMERAVARGPAEQASLCERLAAAVARRSRFADVTEVAIVTGSHDAVAFLVDGVRGREVERVRCPVTREPR